MRTELMEKSVAIILHVLYMKRCWWLRITLESLKLLSKNPLRKLDRRPARQDNSKIFLQLYPTTAD